MELVKLNSLKFSASFEPLPVSKRNYNIRYGIERAVFVFPESPRQKGQKPLGRMILEREEIITLRRLKRDAATAVVTTVNSELKEKLLNGPGKALDAPRKHRTAFLRQLFELNPDVSVRSFFMYLPRQAAIRLLQPSFLRQNRNNQTGDISAKINEYGRYYYGLIAKALPEGHHAKQYYADLSASNT